jgi:hypothetical protein
MPVTAISIAIIIIGGVGAAAAATAAKTLQPEPVRIENSDEQR